MDEQPVRGRKVPVWMVIVILVFMLPVLVFPSVLALTSADSPARILAWFYPFYVIASGVCAYICYPERREVSWILLVLMALSHLAMWFMVMNPQS